MAGAVFVDAADDDGGAAEQPPSLEDAIARRPGGAPSTEELVAMYGELRCDWRRRLEQDAWRACLEVDLLTQSTLSALTLEQRRAPARQALAELRNPPPRGGMFSEAVRRMCRVEFLGGVLRPCDHIGAAAGAALAEALAMELPESSAEAPPGPSGASEAAGPSDAVMAVGQGGAADADRAPDGAGRSPSKRARPPPETAEDHRGSGKLSRFSTEPPDMESLSSSVDELRSRKQELEEFERLMSEGSFHLESYAPAQRRGFMDWAQETFAGFERRLVGGVGGSPGLGHPAGSGGG